MKKTIFHTALFLFWATVALAQADKARQLEEQSKLAEGSKKLELLLALSDAHVYAGAYDKAIDAAESAESLASKLKMPEQRAAALNREGKARMLGGKRKAASAFEQSMKVLRDAKSNNKTLALDNLENLRSLAERSGSTKETAKWEQQIARLKSGNSITAATEEAKAPELQKELIAAQQQLIEKETALKESQNKMLRESKALQQKLADQQKELDAMTDAQMRSAMLLMQQKLLLDSVYYRRGIDSLAISNANLALREAESNRNFNYAIMAALFILAGGALFSFLRARQNAKVLEEKNKIIREEQQRSENLLLNILPNLVAEELKKQGRTKARFYDDVSVLFADFVGFSKIAEQLTPQQLVNELDTCFQQFDDIVSRYGLEKIKTIGDAYMCAGGLPDGGGPQVRDMVAAAMEMQAWLAAWNSKREKQGQPRFDARIGIHRGPVVAGVVGSRKFAFDIWGDTVNVAARVEQAGEGGRINISGDAYEAAKDFFPCQYRGKIAAKNKGEIDMYFIGV
jgi:class 3 adenylate cyclase